MLSISSASSCSSTPHHVLPVAFKKSSLSPEGVQARGPYDECEVTEADAGSSATGEVGFGGLSFPGSARFRNEPPWILIAGRPGGGKACLSREVRFSVDVVERPVPPLLLPVLRLLPLLALLGGVADRIVSPVLGGVIALELRPLLGGVADRIVSPVLGGVGAGSSLTQSPPSPSSSSSRPSMPSSSPSSASSSAGSPVRCSLIVLA
mmetsp:Transcript_79826/g.205349  ORF Transcript_79826/g.205349 Transcript_79826/m.205349 type:complete len:207 (+) Transcript_79826:911-1531(+)